MIIKTQRLTAPSVEPVSLAEVKAHLRQDLTDEDTLIQAYISAARDYAEKFCNRAWAKADFFFTIPAFTKTILLADPGTSDIIEIAYLDENGDPQTVPLYDVTADYERQELRHNTEWPAGSKVKIKYTAGADASASPAEYVPDAIKSAILLVVADLFENRAAQSVLQVYENKAAEMLMYPYRESIGI